jgi:glycosyltransferase involved in cell wall biosynthesis
VLQYFEHFEFFGVLPGVGTLPCMARPRVSVLVPVFNAAGTLTASLESIQRQIEIDWECIVVDDGSTDRSRGIAEVMAAADRRFRVIASEHRGLVAALNIGIAQCRGEYIARMDADDLMHRSRLVRQADALDTAPDLAGLGCHVRIFPRDGLGSGMRAYERWINAIASEDNLLDEVLVECPIAHPTLMIRREDLRSLGYRDCGWPEDYDLVLRALRGGHRLGVIPERLLAWRNLPTRLSQNSDTYATERFVACKAAHIAETLLKNDDCYALWGYGSTGRALVRALRTHRKHPAVIVELHPGRIGNQIAGAPVVHPDQFLASRKHPLVVSVAGEIARTQIREVLAGAQLRERVDFVCAA